MNQPPNYPPPPGWTPPPPPPARPRWGRFAAWTAGVAVAAFAIGGGLAVLTDDDGDEPIANPTACKAALSEGAREAMVAGDDATPATALPAPCVGLDEATLQRLTGEAMAEYLDSPEAGAAFEDAMREALESAFPSTGP
ncbi:hypothetical protein [Streptomyces sp. NPDC058812]|uniref:hypothetical protein n=1 Tax=unclassified Streptomyces TaxID=2593676 RepID=UPI0036B66633